MKEPGRGRIGLALLIGALVAPSLSAQQSDLQRGEPIASQEEVVASPGYGRRHALVVGIDAYQDPAYPELGYAVADATAVARLLVDRFGFAGQDVRLLVDRDATKIALDEALEVWASDPDRIGPDDLLVIFFAGHGVTRDLGSRGSRGYLVPVDGRADRRSQPNWASLFGMNDLEDVSEAIPAKHALFLLDCCFGGLAVNRAAPPVAAGLSSRARQVITAGGADQTVLDSGGRAGHSVFTGAILDALEGKADLDADGVVTFGELFNHVGRDVEKKTGDRQTPLQSTFKDHEGGSVALFPPGLEPGRMSAAERLKAMERTVDEQFAEVKRLSDALLIQDLIAEADTLFPVIPEQVPAFRNWLARARDLAARRVAHEESVRIVRQEAYLTQVISGLLEEGDGVEPRWEEVDPDLRWRYQIFSTLLEDLDRLDLCIPDLEERLAWALRIEQLTLAHPKANVTWEEAREAIASADGVLASELYRQVPIDLQPQLGLVPLGVNPSTLLWEFLDLRSAYDPDSGVDPAGLSIPLHAEDGRLPITEGSGLVFILIPGGSFWMGAQPESPDLPNYAADATSSEAPVHQVDVEPFLLSRYEMTQGQWQRLTGETPSYFQAGNSEDRWSAAGVPVNRTHPVERVSWFECVRQLRRASAGLPTEAQWEYAARAGTTTPWWTGSDLADLDEAGNVSDGYGKTHGNEAFSVWEDSLDDGHSVHAPVGSYRANPFGLHDVIGNVWEWSKDPFGAFQAAGRADSAAGPGSTSSFEGEPERVARGGSFYNSARNARSARRFQYSPSFSHFYLGCRPVRKLTGAR